MYRAAVGVIGACLLAPAAAAQTGPVLVHFGASQVTLADKGETSAGGSVIAGAETDTDNAYGASVEASWFVWNDLAVAGSVHGPFETENVAAGTLSGLGNLGTDKFALLTLGGQWHFNRRGMVSPYLGGGLANFHVLSVEDGAVQNLDIDDASGGYLQAGVLFVLAPEWHLYADVKQMQIETEATGTLGGAPIQSTATLDPLLFSAGFGMRF